MTITIDGATGITTPDLTSAAPMDVGGSAVLTTASSLASANLTGTVASGRMPAGSLLQVVSFETATTTNTSSSSFVASLITVSITPSSATSKILVTASTTGYAPVNYSVLYTFFRNNSVELSGSANGYGGHWIAGQRGVIPMKLTHLDSPNTTSATSYTVYFRGDGATVDTPDNGVATITAMEIAG